MKGISVEEYDKEKLRDLIKRSATMMVKSHYKDQNTDIESDMLSPMNEA